MARRDKPRSFASDFWASIIYTSSVQFEHLQINPVTFFAHHISDDLPQLPSKSIKYQPHHVHILLDTRETLQELHITHNRLLGTTFKSANLPFPNIKENSLPNSPPHHPFLPQSRPPPIQTQMLRVHPPLETFFIRLAHPTVCVVDHEDGADAADCIEIEEGAQGVRGAAASVAD